MGQIKGLREYKKFENGDRLTRKQAILAQCYMCNGFEASNEDCKGRSCPLYQYQPYHNKVKRSVGRESDSFKALRGVI